MPKFFFFALSNREAKIIRVCKVSTGSGRKVLNANTVNMTLKDVCFIRRCIGERRVLLRRERDWQKLR